MFSFRFVSCFVVITTCCCGADPIKSTNRTQRARWWWLSLEARACVCMCVCARFVATNHPSKFFTLSANVRFVVVRFSRCPATTTTTTTRTDINCMCACVFASMALILPADPRAFCRACCAEAPRVCDTRYGNTCVPCRLQSNLGCMGRCLNLIWHMLYNFASYRTFYDRKEFANLVTVKYCSNVKTNLNIVGCILGEPRFR